MNNDTNTITFNPSLIKRLNNAFADAAAAVAEAALAAVAQDKRITVRAFASALRAVAPALGTNNAVLSAAVKAAKIDKATAVTVAEAMADALDKKRRDDAKRAADKREAAPQKALEKALNEVEECKLALRTPLEKAWDNYDTAKMAVSQAEQVLADAVNALAEAEKALAELVKPEQTEQTEG